MVNIKKKCKLEGQMKKTIDKSTHSPKAFRRNSGTRSIKKLVASFKSYLSLEDDEENRIKWTLAAPHNTSSYIIESHPEVLFDVEDLMGSVLMYDLSEFA